MGKRRYGGAESEFAAVLRAMGRRATPARVDILTALATERYPVSIRDLAARVPAYDESTLHRSLETLEAAGLVKKIRSDPARSRYEIEIGRPHHHHVTCTSCGAMEDVTGCVIDVSLHRLEGRLRTRRFSRITDHSLEFFGLCKRCAPD